jgi:hypothetical protein
MNTSRRPGGKPEPRSDMYALLRCLHDTAHPQRAIRITSIGQGRSTSDSLAIVHFGSVGRLWGLFERSKAT